MIDRGEEIEGTSARTRRNVEAERRREVDHDGASVLAREHVAAVPQIEVDDAAAVHLCDRLFEISDELRRETARQTAGDVYAGSKLEHDRGRIEPAEQARNGGDPGEPVIGAFLATEQPRPEPAPYEPASRRKILDDDGPRLRVDQKHVGVAPATAGKYLADSTHDLVPRKARHARTARAQSPPQLERPQKSSSAAKIAIKVPSSLLSE